MALSATERDILDNSNPDLQNVAIGTEIYNSQTNITSIQSGKGITLPTSDPAVSGELWSNSGIVTVSSG